MLYFHVLQHKRRSCSWQTFKGIRGVRLITERFYVRLSLADPRNKYFKRFVFRLTNYNFKII